MPTWEIAVATRRMTLYADTLPSFRSSGIARDANETAGEKRRAQLVLQPGDRAPGKMKTLWLPEVEQDVLRRIEEAAQVFCFLDYDGTLAPLAPTPDEALPLPETAPLLRSLAAAPSTLVALVTGRPIADVRRFLDIPELYYVGIHGLEIMLPNENAPTTEGIAMLRAILPRIRRELQGRLGQRDGILIEDKGAALACHYRLASPADGAAARRLMAEQVQLYQRRGLALRLEHGHQVTEIRSVHANKGKTVCALLAADAPAALPIYIGDDRTDMDAFKLLPRHAITIHVTRVEQPTPARYWLPSPQEVHDFLRAVLARRLRSGVSH